MDKEKLIAKIRREIGDNEEPQTISNDRLKDIIEDAVNDYSGHRPITKKGIINVEPGIKQYKLPDDCQTWLSGLEGCEILSNTLYLPNNPLGSYDIEFNYLADHTIESIPNKDIPIIVDYCMWKLLSDIVKEGAEISGLKLGKGLDIDFANFDEINKLANERLENYNKNVVKVSGGCS